MLLFISVAGFFSSCSKDVIDNPSTDFILVNKVDSIYADQLVTFDFSGSSADNITIYTGDPGHAYANYPIDKGAAVTTPYSKYYYTYPQGGDFTITVVAENAGSDGKTVKTVLKTLSVTVKDTRNPLITKFVLKKGSVSYTGTINNATSTINVKVDPNTDITKLLPVITKSYDSLKVTYGDTYKAFIKTDSLDFTNPVKFKISTNASSALASTSKEYTLTVTKRAKYALSSLLKLTSTNSKLSFTTDTANKKVTIKVPWGISLITDSLKAKITATTFTGAVATWKSVVLNGKNAIPFNVPNSSLDTIKVTSESGVVTSSYPVSIVQKNAFTSFTLNDSINGLSASSQLVTINNVAKTIEVKLFGQSSILTKGYIATFVGADYGTVTINNVKQVSGTTKNYYPSTGLVFTITSKETNLTTTYTVTLVQVAKKK